MKQTLLYSRLQSQFNLHLNKQFGRKQVASCQIVRRKTNKFLNDFVDLTPQSLGTIIPYALC